MVTSPFPFKHSLIRKGQVGGSARPDRVMPGPSSQSALQSIAHKKAFSSFLFAEESSPVHR